MFRKGREAGGIAVAAFPQYHKRMNLGVPEMIFIFLLALIIFGPKKLPEIGRQVGKALNEFKRASNEFKAQIESEMGNLDLTDSTRRPTPTPSLPPSGTVASGTLPAPDESQTTPSTSDHEVPSPSELNQGAKAPDA
jgi:TatA/E family protein of Tat protein translocase